MNDVHGFINSIQAKKILEIGTRRWGKNPTHHKASFPNHEKFVMLDYLDGEDVDVVADAHEMSKFVDHDFDFFYSASTFEHLERPWEVSAEIEKILRPGGGFFIQTHFNFPEHGFPFDYFRYTTEGLKSLFKWSNDVKTFYQYPCTITPGHSMVWDKKAPMFLNVCAYGTKPK